MFVSFPPPVFLFSLPTETINVLQIAHFDLHSTLSTYAHPHWMDIYQTFHMNRIDYGDDNQI